MTIWIPTMEHQQKILMRAYRFDQFPVLFEQPMI
jgi:hypothetical protein